MKSTRLLDQLREQIRYLNYSLRTEEAYVYWVKKFIYFHQNGIPIRWGRLKSSSARRGGLVTRSLDGVDKRARRVMFTATGLDWLAAFERAVGQAEAEFHESVGQDVATVVAMGLEAYGAGY